MNLKIWLPLALAVVLGLAAAFMALNLASAPSDAPVDDTPKYTEIVVTTRPIPAGSRITADALKLSSVKIEDAPGGAFTSTDQVVERISLFSYGEGQTVLQTQTADKDSAAGIAALLSPGTRAVVVKIDEEIAESGILMPESRVDIVGTVFGNENNPDISRTFVRDVKIIAVGRQTSRHLAETGEGMQAQETVSQTATLEVTLEEAQVLELAFRSAKPRLVLRPMNDGEPIEIPAFTLNDLRGQSDFNNGQLPGFDDGLADFDGGNDPFAGDDPGLDDASDIFADKNLPKTQTITVIRGGVETQVTVPVREPKPEAAPAKGELDEAPEKPKADFWAWLWDNDKPRDGRPESPEPVIAGDASGFEGIAD